MMRVTCLLLSLGLLAACEGESVSSTPVAQPAESLPAPAATPSQAIEPKAARQEAAAVPVAGKTAIPDKPLPGPGNLAASPEPRAALDLSVPRELLELLPGDTGDSELSPLLPPLFVDKDEALSPFQLSGRLISNERVDDYWNAIEGAELQFEFRQ